MELMEPKDVASQSGEAMVGRPCPICGSTDESRLVSDARLDPSRLDAFAFASRKIPEYMHHRLVLCSACDLLYASPVPSVEAVSTAYRDASFDSGDEARYASRTYADYLRPIIDRLPDRDGAIDIGTGDGAFLRELLAAGFTGVVGVEPSTMPVASAPDEIRALIRNEIFDPDHFERGRYSLVTCFQTMEHVHDPLALARGAHALLKEGGAAFFIGHDRTGLVNLVLGKRSPIYDIEHLQLFSPRSAVALFERGVRRRQGASNRESLSPSLLGEAVPFPQGDQESSPRGPEGRRDRRDPDRPRRRQPRDRRIQGDAG